MTGTCNPHQTALDYAAKGWRVVPIIPNEKRPPLASWQRLATTDTELINRWWMGDYQSYGVGIATGEASGIWVLDIDDRDALYELEREHGELPPTLTSITGSGGEHQFFAYPADGRIITNSASGFAPGIDVRGEGGQVVAPPSVHPNGNRYEWDEQCNSIAVAPEWLLKLVCKKHNQPAPAPAVGSGHEVSYPVGDMVLTMDSERTPIGDQFLAAMGIGPEPAAAPTAAPAPVLINLTDSPGDLYAAANDWHQILTPDGWQYSHTDNNHCSYWTRPGKELRNGSTSATTGHTANDNLHVFTSSVPHLDAEGNYTKFGYYAATHHGGDHSAAARQLAAEGYRADPATSCDPHEVPNTAAEGGEVNDWEPQDLTAAISGELKAPKPTIGMTSTGECLFYDGQVNGIHGESGIGKTWTLQLPAVQEIQKGNHVVWIDLEDPNAASMVTRLRALGVTDQQLRTQLHYIHPDSAAGSEAVATVQATIKATQASLCVIDSMGEAFSLESLNENNDSEVGPWIRRVLRPLADTGTCVVVIDHATKSRDNPLHASGSKRKRAAITGASYLVTAPQPLSRNAPGKLTVTVAKDRHGYRAAGTKAATITLESHLDGGITWAIHTPTTTEQGEPSEVSFAAAAAAKACEQYQSDHGSPPSKNGLSEAMSAGFKGGSELKRAGIELAISSGSIRVETGPRNSQLHHFVRRYEVRP
jgi:hypothetical protein